MHEENSVSCLKVKDFPSSELQCGSLHDSKKLIIQSGMNKLIPKLLTFNQKLISGINQTQGRLVYPNDQKIHLKNTE